MTLKLLKVRAQSYDGTGAPTSGDYDSFATEILSQNHAEFYITVNIGEYKSNDYLTKGFS